MIPNLESSDTESSTYNESNTIKSSEEYSTEKFSSLIASDSKLNDKDFEKFVSDELKNLIKKELIDDEAQLSSQVNPSLALTSKIVEVRTERYQRYQTRKVNAKE